jgi:hypothetical protein
MGMTDDLMIGSENGRNNLVTCKNPESDHD